MTVHSFFISIYGAVCVQLADFSVGDWKDMSKAYFIIIINSAVSTFSIITIFARGCMPEMFAAYHILSLNAYTFRENRYFDFIIINENIVV